MGPFSLSMKVAIQGGKASFHDIASRAYFSDVEVEPIECNTFRKVCETLGEGVEYGLMAIENSIAGSILSNYSLIKEYELRIIGEIKLRIEQNLMALPGQQISEIKKVSSHYMALLQCSEFLDQYPEMELEEFYDTADSAREIKEKQRYGTAAVAGALAAELYGLEILERGIETIKLNFTRFLVLTKKPKEAVNKQEVNKATLSFELPHQVGALAEILKIIVDNELNLTKIQSVPIIGKPDEYTFYVDCMWAKYSQYERCLAMLRNIVINPRILGEYKNWEINYDHFSS